jgi:hypothetical protein
MTAQAVVPKDPSDIADYVIDWSRFLGVATIASAIVTVETGITKVQQSNTTTSVTVRLSGGTAGAQYTITCQATLSTGEVFQRSFEVAVEER